MGENKLNKAIVSMLISLTSILLAFLIGGIVILLLGKDPVAAYGALVKGAFGTPVAFTVSLSKAVPLILTGLAVAVAMKTRVFNIGAEGQLLMGAFAAAYVGITFTGIPAWLHVTLAIAASAVAGALWALIAGVLKYARNVHVVISTIMLNYIATYLLQYFINGPFRDRETAISATRQIADSSRLPLLLAKPLSLNAGFIIALVMIAAVYLLFRKTTTGYEMRAVGFNPSASNVAGINVQKRMLLSLIISGALAGIAGGIEITGSMFRLVDGFSPGYGFNGIPVSLMAQGNPFAIFFSALLLGAMRNGALLMQIQVGVSQDIVGIVQGLVIIFIGCEYLIRHWYKKVFKGGGVVA